MATIRGKKKNKKQSTRKRNRARRVRIGTPDQHLTPAAGVEATREADRVLGVTTALNAGIGPGCYRR